MAFVPSGGNATASPYHGMVVHYARDRYRPRSNQGGSTGYGHRDLVNEGTRYKRITMRGGASME